MHDKPTGNQLLTPKIFDLERPTLHYDNIVRQCYHDGLELIFNNNYTFRV